MFVSVAKQKKELSVCQFCPEGVEMDIWLWVILSYEPNSELSKSIWDKVELNIIEEQPDPLIAKYHVTDILIRNK